MITNENQSQCTYFTNPTFWWLKFFKSMQVNTYDVQLLIQSNSDIDKDDIHRATDISQSGWDSKNVECDFYK